MRNLIITLIAITGIGLSACDKESYGDSYGLTGESLAPYIELTSKARANVVEGTTVQIPVRLRTAIQAPITVTYEISGAFTRTGTATIAREATTLNIPVAIPASLVGANEDFKTATLKLVSAVVNGENMTIGLKGAALEVRQIRILKNMVTVEEELEVVEAVGGSIIEIPLSFSSALKAETKISYTINSVGGNTSASLTIADSNPLIVPAGVKDTVITLNVKDDLILNSSNKYEIKITGINAPPGAELYIDDDANITLVTVVDDLKTVGFALSTTPIEVTTAGNKNFEVTLSSSSSTSISVPFTVTGGILGVDYSLVTPGLISFPAGSTSSNVNINILPTYSPGKTLTIQLGAIAGVDAEASIGVKNKIVLNLK